MSAGASTWAQPTTSQQQRQGKSRNADASHWLNMEPSPLQTSRNPPSRAHSFSLILLQDRRSPGEGSGRAAHGKRCQKSRAPAPCPGAGQGSQCPEGSPSCPLEERHSAQPGPCTSSGAVALPLSQRARCLGLHSASATRPLPTWEVWSENQPS